MKNSTKYIIACIVAFLVGVICMFGLDHTLLSNNSTHIVESEQWGGAVPMKIYTVYDRDTGVYYAVTEKGGICVMETMSGETKLVDQGDGSIIHPNKGEKKDAA